MNKKYRKVEITCHGCKRKTDALILKQWEIKKNITDNKENPTYPLITILKITKHRQGLLKGICNRSGKKFKVKGTTYVGDMDDEQDIGIK
ncbi:hypothetical protein C6988_03530 [Nitrosopumilus sp. b1]|uniref:hypothetical protein n=1 Tax=Nitrosopumilus sp. b1 TaxID=2109907 RepID=UPI0015F66AA4|nr:hypothetical protein [Nitrosopumilus sp. b1]KAF6243327.1 hypothetical protein C6988_03530 [Nitrosopumilus sp. b1]